MSHLKKISFFSLCMGALFLSACDKDYSDTGTEYAPNMYHAIPYEPFRQNADFKNPYNKRGGGNNLWYPVKGTVSRRNYRTSFKTDSTAATDLMVYDIPKDSIAIAERELTNPVPQNKKSLAEGKELYTRYCLHCHGENGKGDGLVAAAYKGVPNGYRKDMNDGHIFHVITHGKGRMWPHGSQVNPEERWKIVQYVHELQKQ